MQELNYVVHIEDGIVLDEVFLETLDQLVQGVTGCKIIRSKIEDNEAIVESGDWEEEDEQ
jgi:hypothetical protein